MPQDRFIHPKRGKLAQFIGLTDLEWRVHDAYLIAADNFGVMRFSSHTLKVSDGGLATRPDKMLLRCLETLIDRGILVDYHDGDRRYVCALDWQDDQKVKYPTRTYDPKPPDALIARMTPKTRLLFTKHPGGKMDEEDFDDGDSDTDRENFPSVDRPEDRLTAQGSRLKAFQKEEGQREWFAAFYAGYPKKKGKEAAWKAWVKLGPDPALRAQIAAALEQQRYQPDWVKDGGQFVPNPATWLNGRRWEDEAVSAMPHVSKAVQNLAAANASFLAGGE